MELNLLGSVGTVLKLFGPKPLRDTFESRSRSHPVEALFDPQSPRLCLGTAEPSLL